MATGQSYVKPALWGLAAVLPILVLSIFINSSVVSYRLRELDRDLNAAARTQKENRNLAMIAQYDLLKNRMHKEREDDTDYKREAELQTLASQDNVVGQITLTFMDPIAALAIRGIRFLMGKEAESDIIAVSENNILQGAYLYERKRQYRKAIKLYEDLLKQNSSKSLKSDILLHMGFCNTLIGQFDLARLLLREVIESFSGTNEALVAARLYLKLEIIDLARLNESNRVRETRNPFLKAKSLFRQLRYRDAVRELQELLRKNPGHNEKQEVLFLMGRSFEEMGNHKNALLAYQGLLENRRKGPWTKRAYQRSLMIASFYQKDSRIAADMKKSLPDNFEYIFANALQQIKEPVATAYLGPTRPQDVLIESAKMRLNAALLRTQFSIAQKRKAKQVSSSPEVISEFAERRARQRQQTASSESGKLQGYFKRAQQNIVREKRSRDRRDDIAQGKLGRKGVLGFLTWSQSKKKHTRSRENLEAGDWIRLKPSETNWEGVKQLVDNPDKVRKPEYQKQKKQARKRPPPGQSSKKVTANKAEQGKVYVKINYPESQKEHDFILNVYRSKHSIHKIINGSAGQWMSYYVHRQSRNPFLEGRVIVAFSITPQGQAGDIRIASTTVNDAKLEKRIVKVFQDMLFEPIPRDMGSIDVQYTIPFVPIKRSSR